MQCIRLCKVMQPYATTERGANLMLKNRVRLTTTLDKDLLDALEKKSQELGVNKSRLFDEAVFLLLENRGDTSVFTQKTSEVVPKEENPVEESNEQAEEIDEEMDGILSKLDEDFS